MWSKIGKIKWTRVQKVKNNVNTLERRHDKRWSVKKLNKLKKLKNTKKTFLYNFLPVDYFVQFEE